MAGKKYILILGLILSLIGANLFAGVGDPQIKTDHTWYPGELSCSTFARLFATQTALYLRETGRSTASDEDKAIASWYWRNLNYHHSTSGEEDVFGTGYDYSPDEYWGGLFAYGFALCGTTHGQWNAEMEYLLGHCRSRVMGVTGHNSFEVFLTGGSYGAGDWALLDHDVSNISFDATDTYLLGIDDIVGIGWQTVIDNAGAPSANKGWFQCGLYYNSPSDSDGGVYTSTTVSEPLGGWAGAPPILNLRRGEKFRRYNWPGLGGSTYAYWGIRYAGAGIEGPLRNRTWVNQPSLMYQATADTPAGNAAQGSYANGVYTYTPDFTTTTYQDGVISETGGQVTFYFYSPYIIASDGPDASSWTCEAAGGTKGFILTGSSVGCTVDVSTDNGTSFQSGGTLNNSLDLTDLVKGHHSYLVRFNTGAPNLAGKGLSMETVVQCNQRLVPRLDDSGSTVTYEASNTAVFAAGPNADQSAGYIISGAYNSGSPVVLDIPTPRGEDIKEVYVGAHVSSSSPPSPSINYALEYSTNGGSSWSYIVQNWNIELPGYQPGDYWSQSYCFGSVDISSANVSSVQIRASNDGGKSYRRVSVYLVYEVPNNASNKMTFNWTDTGGTKTDTHTYAIGAGGPDTSWTVPTLANATTNWIEFEAIGTVTDNDGDGMDDSWEGTYGLNSSDPLDAGLDSDGDGAINLHEYLAGTDPTGAGSTPDPGTHPGGGTASTLFREDYMPDGDSGAGRPDVVVDTYLDEGAPTNDGRRSSTSLRVEGYESITDRDFPVLWFDLTALPVEAVSSASLWLHRNGGNASASMAAYRLTTDWAGTDGDIYPSQTTCWAEPGDGGSWAAAGALSDYNASGANGAFGTAYPADLAASMGGSAGEWMEFDVTAIASAWQSGTSNYGFIVRLLDTTASSNMLFDSSNAATLNLRPILYIETGSSAANNPPVISAIGASDTFLQVDFTVTATDADGDTMAYAWDFDLSDGADFGSPDSTQEDPTHTYASAGTYLAAVRVTDAPTYNGYDYATVQVTVSNFADSDGDGMPDAWETYFNLNPGSAADASSDIDGDGASALLEFLAGGDPATPANSTYDPEVSDFPATTDSDSDGMWDIDEFGYFGDLSQAGATDFDSDGFNNNQEVNQGYDPTNINDHPPIVVPESSGTKGGCGAGVGSALMALLGMAFVMRRKHK